MREQRDDTDVVEAPFLPRDVECCPSLENFNRGLMD